MTEKRGTRESVRAVRAAQEAGNTASILGRVLETARSLPAWLRFVVVFAVLLVTVVLSGRAIQTNLVPLLYLLLLVGAGGYLWLESRRARAQAPPSELSENEWLDEITRRLTDCGAASVYLRYFRDPDHGDDVRLSGKRDKVRAIMTLFSHLLLDHEARFFLIAFRKRSWTDDPKQWLVRRMTEARPDLIEAEVAATVNKHVLVIHDEPEPNSSTIYLIDDRFLFFNRVTWEIGNEKKTYHAQDLNNSLMPFLIKRGFDDLFHKL